MRRGAVIGVFLAFGALAAQAEEMTGSLRPMPNPAYLLPDPAVLPAVAASSGAEVAAPASPAPSDQGLASSLRPMPRPALPGTGAEGQGLDLAGLATPEPEPAPKGKTKKKKEAESKKGSVCGVAAIKGEAIVTSVSGVRLSQAITVDCATAKALNTWVREVAQPVYGGDIVELKIAAHYICRPRNNKKGAKISEHGRGKAVDIGGFVLDSGKVLTVAGNYNKTMRKAHKGACGIFGTTLGPGSDGYHEDHLHFDTAGYRSGPYCR